MRFGFDVSERLLGRVFPAQWNPLLNLGALGFYFYWIITATGIYVYIFYDTDVRGAYASLEYMTNEQWYAAGVMRSLHRYASDGLVLVMVLHMLREFALDRYRGVRWFSWVTGIPVVVFVFVAGITGYWMVWDQLAQYVAVVSTEWLDRLAIFGEPVARNFFSPDMLESRFFTLMVFIHIAVPLIALIVLWIHLQRVTKPRINPPRGLALGTMISLLALSLVHPAASQQPADLAKVPGDIGLDWFYLPAYPLLDHWPGAVTWGGAGVLLLLMISVPWLPPMRRAPAAVVDLGNCNGCERCFKDCPYGAISMALRSDGLAFDREAVVDPDLCVACGICVGSCPTAMPFRKASELIAGIELPDRTMAGLREAVHAASKPLEGQGRIMVFTCDHGARPSGGNATGCGVVSLPCIGQLPPPFIDYVLSRRLADGVIVAGCAENSCHSRFGVAWTQERLERKRDPHLRERVPAARLRTFWGGRLGRSELDTLIQSFSSELVAAGAMEHKSVLRPTERIGSGGGS